jgi:hypothetical protein
LKLEVGAGARCSFGFRVPGAEEFTVVPLVFTARPSRWVGAKMGLFAERLGAGPGRSEVDYWQVAPVESR